MAAGWNQNCTGQSRPPADRWTLGTSGVWSSTPTHKTENCSLGSVLEQIKFGNSFSPDISISPLQVHYYSEFNMSKRNRQLWVKVHTRRLEWDSNLRPSGHKAPNLPLSHHAPLWPESLHTGMFFSTMLRVTTGSENGLFKRLQPIWNHTNFELPFTEGIHEQNYLWPCTLKGPSILLRHSSLGPKTATKTLSIFITTTCVSCLEWGWYSTLSSTKFCNIGNSIYNVCWNTESLPIQIWLPNQTCLYESLAYFDSTKLHSLKWWLADISKLQSFCNMILLVSGVDNNWLILPLYSKLFKKN